VVPVHDYARTKARPGGTSPGRHANSPANRLSDEKDAAAQKEFSMADEDVEVTVTFTLQQMEVLDKLVREGAFGADHSEVVAALFREFIRQEYGSEGLL
jgi:hypothetical protein